MGLDAAAMTAIKRAAPGAFLALEGVDGVGKSTQHARLVAFLRQSGLIAQAVREPGGTAVGERIRELLLDLKHAEMAARCEVMLYMASRAQLIDEVIAPALARGETVVADRFAQSTIAYQGAGGAVPPGDIERIARIACGKVWPDLVVIFDMAPDAALARVKGQRDRMEQKDDAYRARVRQAYLDMAQREPERHAVIDAAGGEEAVFARLLRALADWAGRRMGGAT